MSKTKVVILGAGYGGVVSTLRLQKALHYNEAEITLVSKHDYHYITTELHQPAAGTMHHDRARVNLDELIDTKKVNVVQDTVQEIKTEERKVLLANSELEYDYLVVGIGSEPETFGISGLLENSFCRWNIEAARKLRQHIEYQFATYHDEPERTERLTFIVGGAGFTGIEFVGELTDRIPQLCNEYDVDPGLVRIVNIEAAPTALPGFDPELVEYAMEVLTEKGVEFKIDMPIKECTENSVILNNGEEIKSDTIVWTGGVRGNSILEKSGFETMRGRIKVDEYLRAPGYEREFIVGDGALIINEETERPYPPTAQMAIQHGDNIGKNIPALIRGGELTEFNPDMKGTVASLGKNEAIGIVFGRKIKGWQASIMKKLIDLRYLFIIGGIPLVLRKGRF